MGTVYLFTQLYFLTMFGIMDQFFSHFLIISLPFYSFPQWLRLFNFSAFFLRPARAKDDLSNSHECWLSRCTFYEFPRLLWLNFQSFLGQQWDEDDYPSNNNTISPPLLFDSNDGGARDKTACHLSWKKRFVSGYHAEWHDEGSREQQLEQFVPLYFIWRIGTWFFSKSGK